MTRGNSGNTEKCKIYFPFTSSGVKTGRNKTSETHHLQTGRTFSTLYEAEQFAKNHKQAWIHRLYEGAFEHRSLAGFHVVYIQKD
jgi:hypothetical protein